MAGEEVANTLLVSNPAKEIPTGRKSKENKRKGIDSEVEAITLALKALPLEQQVTTLLTKLTEVTEEKRKLQGCVKNADKQVQLSQREKDQLESDHSKIVLSKSRLESLCRELQRQNKVIKDENVCRLRDEEEKRKEISVKFNTTMAEISGLMKENSEKNAKLRDENQEMSVRLQELVAQYEERESYTEKVVKQRDLQMQLAEAKLQKLTIESSEDKEQMLMEKKKLLEEIGHYQKQAQQMSLTEIALRTQLSSYTEKYTEFQTTLDRSSKLFETFKKEMDEMAKKIKKLEGETRSWKERCEGANKALLEMVNERETMEKKIENQLKQNSQLQSLCRALQQQLTELRSQCKEELKEETVDEVSAVDVDNSMACGCRLETE